MTCIEILKSISYDNFVEAITHNFSENMALYRVLQRSDEALAITGIPTEHSIAFVIRFDEEYKNDKLNIMIAEGDMSYISIYGHNFSVQCRKTSTCESYVTLTEICSTQ